MEWRSRWTFWAVVAAVLALVSVPSADWLKALSSYADLAAGWQPAPLKPLRVSFTPRERGGLDELPALAPVEFRHKAPKAKSVELIGDFNAWTPGLLKLKRGDGGFWTLVAPVPPGRRKYLFLVDGRAELDAGAEAAAGPKGGRVSARTVK